MSSSLAPALRLLSCSTCLRRFCNSDKNEVLPKVRGAGAASPTGTALAAAGALEGAEAPTVEALTLPEPDAGIISMVLSAGLLLAADAAGGAGDLLGVSLLPAPLSNASNSSSSNAVKASTSRCDGKDIRYVAAAKLGGRSNGLSRPSS